MDNKLILPYNHIQTAHCENGVATGLLRHHGLEFMTEPLMFERFFAAARRSGKRE